MPKETDRMARAGNYVLGLMNEEDRERAERDLERDQSFRDDVLRIAERMRLIGTPNTAGTRPDVKWQAISARIAELPQMRGTRAGETLLPDVTTSTAVGSATERGGHAPAGRRALVAVICLVAVFAIGYVAGASSPGLF